MGATPLYCCYVMVLSFLVFFYMPAGPPRPILFPYTTLFRSRTSAVSRGSAARATAMICSTDAGASASGRRSEEHTSELQSRQYLVCRLLLEKKKNATNAA